MNSSVTTRVNIFDRFTFSFVQNQKEFFKIKITPHLNLLKCIIQIIHTYYNIEYSEIVASLIEEENPNCPPPNRRRGELD